MSAASVPHSSRRSQRPTTDSQASHQGQASGKGQPESQPARCCYNAERPRSGHPRSRASCALPDPRPVLLIAILVPRACRGHAGQAFVPRAAFHTARFRPQHRALATWKTGPTSSREPVLLKELPSNIETKRRCWRGCSCSRQAGSGTKIQVECLSSILSSESGTEEGALTPEVKFKSRVG